MKNTLKAINALLAWLQSRAIALLWLGMELLGAALMGHGTLVASYAQGYTPFEAIATMLLIDGIMLASLLIIAYVPARSDAQRNRRVGLSGLAALMYAIQLAIGWNVGGWLGIAGRASVGAVLALRTGEFISEYAKLQLRRIRDARAQDTRTAGRVARDARQRAWKMGYTLGNVLLLPVTIALGVVVQVLALVFVDVLGGVAQGVQRWAQGKNASAVFRYGEQEFAVGTRRTPDPYNNTRALSDGSYAVECALCGPVGTYANSHSAGMAYAAHTRATAHGRATAQAVRG